MPDKADLLAQFSRKPQSRSPQSSEPPDENSYVAFKAVDRPRQRLGVRPAGAAWERLSYAYLLRIVEDGYEGTHLALVFTFCVVVVQGRNLRLVADAIDGEGCEFIQQYDPKRWEKPSDPSAPFIESIDVHVESLAQASDEARAKIDKESARH